MRTIAATLWFTLVAALQPVHGAGPEPLSFVDDILPVLGKAGCSGSSCHSKPAGQNGFKLSVFAYDPRADYAEIVYDGHGRRVSPGAPEQSLILLKATQTVPHEGGERFDRESEAYHTIVRWIREGAPYQLSGDAPLSGIAIAEESVPHQPGASGRLQVTAHYENGRERDVTAWAEFHVDKEEIVEVEPSGQVRVRDRAGEAVIVARFLGQVATARVTLPQAGSPASLAHLPRQNFIDHHAYQRLEQLGLQPSEPCGDGEFIRRVSIDLIGKLPSADETRAFLEDDGADKRQALVERLLGDPAFADHWAVKWADLLRPNPDRAGVKSVYILDQWLREAFRKNMPMDALAHAVLTAQGSTHRHGPAVVYRDRRTPEDLTSLFSQVFMGVRLECARCHHHPNEKWSQEDYYQMAAFFGQLKRKGTGISPPISGGWEVFFHAPGGTVKHPVTGAPMTPRPPDGPALTEGDSSEDPRHFLAEWLAQPDNPFFSRAMVNRVWGELMGRGLVDPVDDFRVTNPPTNPALLDALAEDFVEHGYDLKHLLRRITDSRVYGQSSVPTASNLHDTENFSRSYRRRLSAEVLTDAVADVTGVPNAFEGLPPESRAVRVWNFKIASDTLDAFGRPDSSSDCPCERNLSTSVVQALHLMNAETLQAKLTANEGRVHALVSTDRTVDEVVDELYLAVYSRYPAPGEREVAQALFESDGVSREEAAEDLLWALLNSAEFVFNH